MQKLLFICVLLAVCSVTKSEFITEQHETESNKPLADWGNYWMRSVLDDFLDTLGFTDHAEISPSQIIPIPGPPVPTVLPIESPLPTLSISLSPSEGTLPTFSPSFFTIPPPGKGKGGPKFPPPPKKGPPKDFPPKDFPPKKGPPKKLPPGKGEPTFPPIFIENVPTSVPISFGIPQPTLLPTPPNAIPLPPIPRIPPFNIPPIPEIPPIAPFKIPPFNIPPIPAIPPFKLPPFNLPPLPLARSEMGQDEGHEKVDVEPTNEPSKVPFLLNKDETAKPSRRHRKKKKHTHHPTISSTSEDQTNFVYG